MTGPAGWPCVRCGSDSTKVRDSRQTRYGRRRRRECRECGTRWTTQEVVAPWSTTPPRSAGIMRQVAADVESRLAGMAP